MEFKIQIEVSASGQDELAQVINALAGLADTPKKQFGYIDEPKNSEKQAVEKPAPEKNVAEEELKPYVSEKENIEGVEKSVTLEDVQALASHLALDGKRPAVINMLRKLGYEKLTLVPVDKLTEAYQLLSKEL